MIAKISLKQRTPVNKQRLPDYKDHTITNIDDNNVHLITKTILMLFCPLVVCDYRFWLH